MQIGLETIGILAAIMSFLLSKARDNARATHYIRAMIQRQSILAPATAPCPPLAFPRPLLVFKASAYARQAADALGRPTMP
jgi:hypothetical protein